MRANLPPLVEIQEQLLQAVDADADAFNEYIAALALPKSTPEEVSMRDRARQQGLKHATLVPFHTMELVDRAWEPLLEIARFGQYSSRSDVEVGAKTLEAGLYGAFRNVMINLPGIEDAGFRSDLETRATGLLARGQEQLAQLQRAIETRTDDP
jgi:glutamate formiminotransferase/formiminotetrahydrofolate cyclodeaminase